MDNNLEDLRKLEQSKLAKEEKDFRKKLLKVKFEVASSQSKNVHLINQYRTQIARIKTIAKEKVTEKNKF